MNAIQYPQIGLTRISQVQNKEIWGSNKIKEFLNFYINNFKIELKENKINMIT
jgi:RNA polymerase-interacting CarD/CdnL/TRCF family regulator